MARIRKTSINTKKEKIKFYLFKYKRLSKEDINSGQSKSIKSQDMVINAYIQRLLDNDEDITIVDEYIDDGVSGMYDTRENWQKMITCIEQTQVTKSEQIIVIVSDLSRGFRNSSDQQYYLENYFLEKNIRFISCELPQLDTLYEPEKIYNLEVQFHGMMNAQYAKDLSTKIKSRLKERRKKGEFVGSFAPYGYKKSQEDNHVLVIDEEVADNIKNIFSWFISGISMRKICERLNELGVINPTSYRKQKGSKYFNPHAENNSALWHAGTIRNILQSEYYIGNLDQHHTETRITPTGKKRINISDDSQIAVNTHDSIIDTDTFNKAQHLLQLDMRFPNNERKHYLFSGFLKCGDCKKAMVRTTVKNEHIYYYCSTYRKLSKNHCTKHTIREDVLNDLVLKAIQAHISIAVSLSDQVNLIFVSSFLFSSSNLVIELLICSTFSSLAFINRLYCSLVISPDFQSRY